MHTQATNEEKQILTQNYSKMCTILRYMSRNNDEQNLIDKMGLKTESMDNSSWKTPAEGKWTPYSQGGNSYIICRGDRFIISSFIVIINYYNLL